MNNAEAFKGAMNTLHHTDYPGGNLWEITSVREKSLMLKAWYAALAASAPSQAEPATSERHQSGSVGLGHCVRCDTPGACRDTDYHHCCMAEKVEPSQAGSCQASGEGSGLTDLECPPDPEWVDPSLADDAFDRWWIENAWGQKEAAVNAWRACWRYWLHYTATKTNPAPPAGRTLTDAEIRTIFLANGFTIKEGLDDLKPYVYQAARAILAAASTTGGADRGHGEAKSPYQDRIDHG